MSDQSIPASATSASDIVEHVERSITAGILTPGMRLAPVRQLAEATGLAPNTVAAAYRTLAARGVVEGRGRHGTFIAAHVGVPQAHAPIPEGMVDLATGNPDPRLLPDLGLHMGRIDTSHVLYGEAQVDPSLERLARGLLEGMGGDSTPLAVVHGALDGVERTLQVRLRVGDAVALEAPGWPAFADLVTALGMRPVPVEVDDRGMIPDRLGRVAGDVAAVIITPRFQNPTGAALDDHRAAELRSVLDPYPDLLVIEDDHGGLIAGVPLAPVAAGRGRWAHVQSFSKSLGPDLRMAILTGDEGTLTALKARQSAGPGWVSHLLQRLVASILEDPSTAGLLQRAIDSYTARRMGLIAALAERGVPAVGRTGINVWIPVPEEEPVVAAMAGAGYAIRAGERWRMGTPPAVRLSISALADDRIDEVAAIVATSVGSRTGSLTTRSG